MLLTDVRPGASGNALLDALPLNALEALAPRAERCWFGIDDVVYHPGSSELVCYLPVRGAVAQFFVSHSGEWVATSIVGREGVVGLPLWLGAPSMPFRAIGIVPGEAWAVRLPADVDGGAPIRRLAAARLLELNQSAACHQLHSVDQRIARWLLEIAERAGMGQLELTHEHLAALIGVARPRITAALGALEATQAVHRGRRRILIRDAAKLSNLACECYAIVREIYANLGIPRPEVAAASAPPVHPPTGLAAMTGTGAPG